MHRRELLKYTALLLGGAASASVSRAVLAAAPINLGLGKIIFNQGQQASVALLSEMIIPTTDTPGAIKAGVPDFIASIVSEWYNDTERKVFFQGLHDLDSHCQAAEGNPFHTASEAVQLASLQEQEQIAAAYKSPNKAGHPMAKQNDESLPFFAKLKELVVVGYYSSEVGATQELSYLPMPMFYDGEYDYSKIGRRWTP
ncbi:MAG: hypothetical protein ACJAST_003826 [Halopseudomonas sp.]|jgi:hypothetical protein